MHTPSEPIEIRHAVHTDELAPALAFVNAQYHKAFGVEPSPPDHMLAAWHGTTIVGTIGINTWHPDTGLRLARLYSFDHAQAEFPIDLPCTVEFARWACETHGIACALLHAATCFSLGIGKKYVWCEHSPAVNRVCRSYGIRFHAVRNAVRNNDRIEDHHRAFYDSTDARLFMFSLEQARPALETYLAEHSVPKRE